MDVKAGAPAAVLSSAVALRMEAIYYVIVEKKYRWRMNTVILESPYQH